MWVNSEHTLSPPALWPARLGGTLPPLRKHTHHWVLAFSSARPATSGSSDLSISLEEGPYDWVIYEWRRVDVCLPHSCPVYQSVAGPGEPQKPRGTPWSTVTMESCWAGEASLLWPRRTFLVITPWLCSLGELPFPAPLQDLGSGSWGVGHSPLSSMVTWLCWGMKSFSSIFLAFANLWSQKVF